MLNLLPRFRTVCSQNLIECFFIQWLDWDVQFFKIVLELDDDRWRLNLSVERRLETETTLRITVGRLDWFNSLIIWNEQEVSDTLYAIRHRRLSAGRLKKVFDWQVNKTLELRRKIAGFVPPPVSVTITRSTDDDYFRWVLNATTRRTCETDPTWRRSVLHWWKLQIISVFQWQAQRGQGGFPKRS